MDFGTVLSVAQTLLSALQCSELKEMWFIMGYKYELQELSHIVKTVRAVLLDAESKQEELSHEALVWLEELKDAVYDADDLLDEFATISAQMQRMEGDKFFKKLCLFFSRFNQVGVAYNMSQGVKKITKKLDLITRNHKNFRLSLEHTPVRRRREETCSYMSNEIIGREEDADNIIGMLLNSDVKHDVLFLSIVGIGGLGKTALTQLVYNDKRVVKEFPLRLWTCVSDHDQKQLDVKAILVKILQSAMLWNDDGASLELLQSRIRETLAGKRYLLVLDDVWTEDRNEWLKLVGSLVGGRGSRIVVTTRSAQTARIMGQACIMYELQGLSEKKSLHLFEQVAFGSEQSNPPPDDLVEIGKQIVKRCVGVPLAVRVAGSLLYGQHKSKWLLFQKSTVANIRGGQGEIMPILKLSYHNLESSLKSCFSYCAVFSKGSAIKKDMLIRLWMAQGYIVPWDDSQSIEEAAEECFSILLRRCFFQDVEIDHYGEIFSCKMHDLMHDLALEVGGQEICTLNAADECVDKKARHVHVLSSKRRGCSFTENHIRTYLYSGTIHERVQMEQIYVDALLPKLTYVRTLALRNAGIKILPKSIGNLMHMRYLDLSENKMEELPRSITKLYNLQTLLLVDCRQLKELPKDMSKLVNLRVLDIWFCDRLNCMPLGMGRLDCLRTLTRYLVGKVGSAWNLSVELEALKGLNMLKGIINLEIRLPRCGIYAKEDTITGGAYLRNKEHLYGIQIQFDHEESREGENDQEDATMEELQPHSNLRYLTLDGYRGGRMPSWARGDHLVASLPHLVRLRLYDCPELKCVSLLGKLQHLKFLTLERLPKLEYVEDNQAVTCSTYRPLSGEGFTFFPCLEKLWLSYLPRLKGWWARLEQEVEDDQLSSSSLALPQLKRLSITDCPELTSIPQCPNVEALELYNFNNRLIMIKTIKVSEETGKAFFCTPSFVTSSSSLPVPPTNYPKLKEVYIGNLGWLQQSLPMEAFQGLSSLKIWHDKELESLAEVAQVFRSCSTSLQTLEICGCPKLRSLCGGLKHLSALKVLTIRRIPREALAEINEDGSPWMTFQHTLQSLEMSCPELQSLPRWIGRSPRSGDLVSGSIQRA